MHCIIFFIILNSSIMKKINGTLALCIGLLSLNTFSSCTQTRQGIGLGYTWEKQQKGNKSVQIDICEELDREELDRISLKAAYCNVYTKSLCLFGAVFDTWFIYNLWTSPTNTSSPSNATNLNSTNLTATTSYPLMSPLNLSDTHLNNNGSIIRAHDPSSYAHSLAYNASKSNRRNL